MQASDWSKIKHFTEKEIRKTGANPEGIKPELLMALDQFRGLVGVPVILVKDGFNSGKHKSPGHPEGRAVDCFLLKKIEADTAFKYALQAGFKAIGIYWNGSQISFHLELGTEYRFWTGKKTSPGVGEWTYGELINDPSKE